MIHNFSFSRSLISFSASLFIVKSRTHMALTFPAFGALELEANRESFALIKLIIHVDSNPNFEIIDCVNWKIITKRMKQLNHKTWEKFLYGLNMQLCSGERRGLNNPLIFLHYFMLFVGDLLFIVSCASPQWIILKQRRNQLPFDASMCSILIS